MHRMHKFRHGFLAGLVITTLLLDGCTLFGQAGSHFADANLLFSQGNYAAALDGYARIAENYPTAGDRALFEMGIIHAYPQNDRKDYRKALECFQQVIREYPESRYRQDSELMVFYIGNISVKDELIATRQAQLEAARQQLQERERELASLQRDHAALQKTLESVERKLFAATIRSTPPDRILIEKGQRRLTLLASGEVLKSYRIALGGDPVGPKERQGDNKTPEGIYVIDGKNDKSRFHLSLHISYPNENDRKRARELGVAPGGDIMIHGIKDGFSWVGDAHAEVDWTKGCIAVTDAEIEEIFKVVPIGTTVEIRP